MNVNLEYCNPFDGEKENIWMKAEHCGRYLFASDLISGEEKDCLRILDAACADGYGTQILCKAGRIVTGADINEGYLDQAKARGCAASFIRLDFDCDPMPFPNDELDMIVCYETIEHLNYPQKLFAEFFRILRPGGKLLLSFPNAIYEKLDESGKNKDPFHKHIFQLQEIKDMLSGAFVVDDILGQFLCNQAYVMEKSAIQSEALTPQDISSIFRYDSDAIKTFSRALAYPCNLHVDESYSYIIVSHKR